MSIIINMINDATQPLHTEMATKLSGTVLPAVTEENVNDFCYCEFECEYFEKVFGSTTSSDFWKNDKNTLIFRRLIAADTVVIKLFKDGVFLSNIVDDTYGDFTNGFVNGTSEQQLYVAFTVEWEKVITLEGIGRYHFETDLNIVGVLTTVITHKFRLLSYSDDVADGTFRIEWTQNGNIRRSQFDFTDLNFYQSMRIKGIFREDTPKREDDRFLDVNHQSHQITASTIPQYTLETERIERLVYLAITRDFVLGNELLITDYNIINETIFRRISVVNDSIDKPDIGQTTRPIIYLTFAERDETIFKRNN